jgi:2,4-dienoyl-CoA reductase-like NADH-dependent reductase (Old Yellow Enzyme family)
MFEKLFEPIQVGNITLRNRIAMAPMVTAYSNQGYVSEQQLAYYAARARGGVGLIVTEHILASEWAKKNCPLNVMGLYDPSHAQGLAELADTIHAFGAHTFIQMNPGLGAQGFSIFSGVQPVGPSEISYRTNPETVPPNIPFDIYMVGETPREMTVDEIEQEQDNFAQAAVFAHTVGFDGIEIHAAHGFLLHEFLSPRFNQRTDEYGGSLENRCRFLVELIQKTRDYIGQEMVLGVRLSAHEPDGTTYEDVKQMVLLLCEEGIDYFHLGDGTFEALNWLLPDQDGTMLELQKTTNLKKDIGIPVITPSIHDPEAAEKAIIDGHTDIVSLARSLLADPEWANKVKDGRVSEITKCIRCNKGCFGRLFGGLTVNCVVNPETGIERYNPAYNRWSLINK